jgi:hypothetical protein
MREHWLARASTVRRIRRAFLALLAATLLAELFVEHEAQFAIEGVFAFGAWYGFLACAALILVARAAGLVLKRPDSYYERDHAAD